MIWRIAVQDVQLAENDQLRGGSSDSDLNRHPGVDYFPKTADCQYVKIQFYTLKDHVVP